VRVINEAPLIQVYMVQSAEAPGGIGEPGTAAVAPAVTNALFSATGKRIRKLPLRFMGRLRLRPSSTAIAERSFCCGRGEELREKGLTHIRPLAGGIEAWLAQGRPIDR